MRFSVIVPGYNAEKTLPGLLASLRGQSFRDFETIFVDDCSQDGTPRIARSYRCHLIELAENHGPAFCRNVGAQRAKGDILVFTDSDCVVERDWLESIQRNFSRGDSEAVMGRLEPLPSTFLGECISALGFPAGGALGFDKIWKVSAGGHTDSLSSCNCAIRRSIFEEAGGFDEFFPYPGGEDSLLAYKIRRLKYRIRYCPDVRAYHVSRDTFGGFVRWQFRRGVSSYIFSTAVTNRKDFLRLRVWSTANILKAYGKDRKLPLVLFLLGSSFLMQSMGFLYARRNWRPLGRQIEH